MGKQHELGIVITDDELDRIYWHASQAWSRSARDAMDDVDYIKIIARQIEDALKDERLLLVRPSSSSQPDDRLIQIRRSHASAKPKAENPAWVHTHKDLDYALKKIAQLEFVVDQLKRG